MNDDMQAMRDEFLKLARLEGNEPIRCSRMHFDDWAETIDDHFLHIAALIAECDALRAELDPPVCRLQFPDGSVPGNAREAAEGWKKVADEIAAERDALAARLAAVEGERDEARQTIKTAVQIVNESPSLRAFFASRWEEIQVARSTMAGGAP